MYTDKGFTLIELLTVIAIIGILAAIAVPQFWAYRDRSYRTVLLHDARTFAVAEEAYYSKHGLYCSTTTVLSGQTYGAKKSLHTIITILNANSTSFTLVATDELHPGILVTYRGANGGIQ